jgi:hypothetical protein
MCEDTVHKGDGDYDDDNNDNNNNKCPFLTKKYIKNVMIDCALSCMYFNIWQEIRTKLEKEHRYDDGPKLVETSPESKGAVSWNQQVRTDRTIPSNKPDIIMSDNEKGTRTLIDDEM